MDERKPDNAAFSLLQKTKLARAMKVRDKLMSRFKNKKNEDDLCIEPIANTLTRTHISGAAVGS